MTSAKCFTCKKELEGTTRTMEDLLEMKLPVFCSQNCANSFPNNGTKDFDNKILSLKDSVTKQLD